MCHTHSLSHTHTHTGTHKVLLKCILRAARSFGECRLNYIDIDNIDAAAQANVRECCNTSITQVITIIVEIKADQRQQGQQQPEQEEEQEHPWQSQSNCLSTLAHFN